MARKPSGKARGVLSPRLIRDADFARRVETACDGNPNIPAYNHGRLTRIKELFEERFKMEISVETVRKWFAGEARPRPDKMSLLAQILEVDVAWLSLGISPEMDPRSRQKRNAAIGGAASVLAGMIQLEGGVVAYPGEKDAKAGFVDLYAIIKGAQYSIHAALARDGEDDSLRFAVPTQYNECTVIGVVKHAGPRCDFIEIPAAVIDEHKKRHGGYYELQVAKRGEDYRVANDRLPKIKSFASRL